MKSRWNGHISEIIKLSQNENPLGPSPKAIEVIREQCTLAHLYPEPHADSVRGTIAANFGRKNNEVLVTAGLIEALDILIRNFVKGDEEIIVSDCSFVAYRMLSNVFGRQMRFAKSANAALNLQGFIEQLSDRSRLILIDNPNNPSGTYLTSDEVEKLLKVAPKEALVVLDEAYHEFVTAPDYPNSLELLKEYPNLLVLRSFSKIHGLAGLRVGYCLADEGIIERMLHFQAPFTVNRLAASAAKAALSDLDFVEKSSRLNSQESAKVYSALKDLKFSVLPTQANFVLIQFDDSAKRDTCFNFLEENQIHTRKADFFGAERGLRISIGLPEENDAVLDCLKAFLKVENKM